MHTKRGEPDQYYKQPATDLKNTATYVNPMIWLLASEVKETVHELADHAPNISNENLEERIEDLERALADIEAQSAS
jgi:uncharacterized protein YceH (UPF0502 family)